MSSSGRVPTSISDQLVVLLRDGISSARWPDGLPSEAALSREFQVSRMTLRKALAQLARERWITLGGSGRRHSIPRRRAPSLVSAGRVVRVLSPFSLFNMGGILLTALETLEERIVKKGFHLEFEHHEQLFHRHQPAKLRQLNALPDTAGWILCFSTKPMQQWFAASGRPCVVGGCVHDDIRLPCVSPDYQAEARHAAGRFYARGHRELVYLISELTSLGDKFASLIFVEEARRLGANARIVEHAPDTMSLHRALGKILATHPRPTGFYSANPGHCLTALYHLHAAGLRIPGDAALIAGWDDPSLDCTIPTMARYRIDGGQLGRKLAAQLLEMLKHGGGKLRAVRMLPEFVNGGTLDKRELAQG